MRGIPLTSEQRDQLLTSYRNRGFQATRPLAESFGVSPRYIARLARMNGMVDNYARGERAIVKKSSWCDPRWQLAIERGGVVV